MAELNIAPKKPTPVGEAGQYQAIDALLEAAGVPADADATALDGVLGDDTKEPKEEPKKAPEDDKTPEDDESKEEETEEEDASEEGQEAEEEEEDAAGAETELDGAALASALGFEDVDTLEFNDEGEILIPWKVEDEKGAATIKDLVRGYQLDKNLTQKSTELSQARQVVEQERTALNTQLSQAIEKATDVAKALQTRVETRYASTDWSKLEAEEGIGAVAHARQEMAAEYQTLQRELEGLDTERDKAAQAHYQQQQTHRKTYIDREGKELVKRIPDFGEAEKAGALRTRMCTYLEAKGLKPDEIKDIIDARQLDVIYDGLRYQEAQKKAKKTIQKVVKTPRIRKGGSPRSKSETTRETRKTLMGRVRKTGSEFDAGRAMLDLGLVDDV